MALTTKLMATAKGDVMICDHDLHVTNKYLQATSKTKRLAHNKLVDAFLPGGLLPKPNLVQ